MNDPGMFGETQLQEVESACALVRVGLGHCPELNALLPSMPQVVTDDLRPSGYHGVLPPARTVFQEEGKTGDPALLESSSEVLGVWGSSPESASPRPALPPCWGTSPI